MDKIQKIGVSAFIHQDGKVLMVKRARDINFLPNYWELPGGQVKYREKLEDAIARKVTEETGLKVKVGFPYAAFSYLREKIQFIDIQYFCHRLNDKIKIDPGHGEKICPHNEYFWATKNIVKKLKITKQMREVILKGFDLIK